MAVPGSLANHAAHFVVFGAPAVALAGLVGFQEIRGRLSRTGGRPGPSGPVQEASARWCRVAAGGTAAAALTHAFVVPGHFEESLLYGLFFSALMSAQVLVSLLLAMRRPTARLLQRVGLGSVAVVGLWLISRTSGLPVGAHPWQPETFGPLDTLASAAELVTALACARLLLGNRVRRLPSSRPARSPAGRGAARYLRDRTGAFGRCVREAARWLPRGHPLPQAVWQRRHAGIVRFALLQALAVGAFGYLRGYAVALCVADVALVGLPGLLARSSYASRRLRTIAATTSLMLASVTVVDVAGGVTEAHFHFFVMVGVVALYQDWTAFSVCIFITVMDHAVMGSLLRKDVYGSPSEQRHPIAWAFVHGGFILAVAFTHLLAWRNNEEQFLSDGLTRLPNRTAFNEALERALAGSSLDVSVLFVDLDNFKSINDSRGHAVGDRALQAAAERMVECVRANDVLARLGGDEFAVVVPGPENVGRSVARRISTRLEEPLPVAGVDVFVRASIGVAFSARHASPSGEELLRCADLAMYLAKSTGKNNVVAYDAEVDRAVRHRAELAASLPRALPDGQLHVRYQPVVTSRDGGLVGVEALVRWDHPVFGSIPPSTFVPLAEETGDIHAIGQWVLQTAAARMVDWNASRPDAPDLTVAVNLSPLQLGQPGFLESVLSTLDVTGLRPELLVLEVTEGLRLNDWTACCDRLTQLRYRGVRIAIDDFGTGYSSLSYLAELPADIVKIDQSFVRDLHAKSGSVFVVNAIMQAARSLGLDVVAEGVETVEQQTVLTKLGCLHSQGYLHSEPLTAEGLTALLRCGRPDSITLPAMPVA